MPAKTKRRVDLIIGIVVGVWMAIAARAQNVVVDAAPSHVVNSFSPPQIPYQPVQGIAGN